MTRTALAALVALGLGGCTAGYLGSDPPAPSGGGGTASTFRQRMSSLFFGSSASSSEPAAAPAAMASDECPGIEVRHGASTLQFATPGAEPAATTLRYQASIARTARECTVRGSTMTIKVGVLGRIIVGPAGSPGQIDVPLRIALVREGVQPKTIWTRFYQFAVTVPPGRSNVPFMHIEEDLSFPIPGRSEFDAYLIYVGFDQQQRPEQPASKKKRRRSG